MLGTSHLNQLAKPLAPAQLQPLLDRLARWQPRVITVEGLSGSDCAHLKAYVARYPETFEQYCWDTSATLRTLGLSLAEADAEIDRTLAVKAADRPAATRRRLAALFIAAGDRPSALVQWLRLAPGERRAGNGIGRDELAILGKIAQGRNEVYAIAAPLAARLGHERVYPTDDHSGDAATGPTDAAFDEALMAVRKTPESARFKAMVDDGDAALARTGDILGYYRLLNSEHYARANMAGDFGAAAAERSPQQAGRRYLAYWEARNLRMVANIRVAYGPTPGTRVLAIVGAAHRPHFERYLGMLSDTRVVDIRTLLR